MKINIVESCRLLKEMAEGLSDIKRKLNNSSEQIRENLMQIFLWRNTTTVNHWTGELYAICHTVSKCKNNGKYPKYSVILQEIWGCWEDSYFDKLGKYVETLEYKENMTAPMFNSVALYQFMQSYCDWLARSLSSEGIVTPSEVKREISLLLTEYSVE